MRLHADFQKAVRLDITGVPWQDSPLPGVERRMLDRVGDEVARATSIVRYAPDSSFSAHIHEGGEEFLVLEGIFSDEHGDYGPGMYVRNPCGSRHTPFSKTGCMIFVKLWQMMPKDQAFVRVDTQKEPWQKGEAGVFAMPLHRFGDEYVRLERWANGTSRRFKEPGGLEILILSGSVLENGQVHKTMSWLRFPPDMAVVLHADMDVRLFVKSGHLACDRALPYHG